MPSNFIVISVIYDWSWIIQGQTLFEKVFQVVLG